MHAMYYMMRNIFIPYNNLLKLGLLISAFCHDIGHTGKTNTFEVNSESRLALRYHDISVY